MSARAPTRNNVLAGLFVIVGLMLAVAMSFFAADFADRLRPKDSYEIAFPVREGVEGVAPGSAVTFGGRPVGRVLGVRQGFTDAAGEPVSPGAAGSVPSEIIVEIGLYSGEGINLYSNAAVSVVQPLLGTMSSINIAAPGGPAGLEGAGLEGAEIALVEPGGRIEGRGAGGLLGQFGLEGEELGQLVRRFSAVAKNVQDITAEIRPQIGPAIEDARAAISNIRDLTGRIRAESDRIIADVTRSLDNIAEFTDGLPQLRDDASGLIGDARGFVARVDGAVEEGWPTVRNMLENADAVVATFRNETTGQISRVLDRAGEAAGEYQSLAEQASGTLREIDPELRRAAANLRLFSGEAVLFIEEVRAAPWRLLNRPGLKEIEEEQLYSSVRRYARAVGDLRAVSESFESALDDRMTGRGGIDDRLLEDLRRRLLQAFDAYEGAEQGLLEALAENRG